MYKLFLLSIRKHLNLTNKEKYKEMTMALTFENA
jgi:hypothetical protein